ncbi:MAG TPA: efflux RND transporter permease subunit [Candidatus Hydrogenedentes bacterium]|nr:efflux RND transporter permease subunit [Candidatus Hydrogenedentota bacterium]
MALSRPITTVMVTLTVLSLGAVAYTRIPLEFVPNAEVPFAACWIPYINATPEQIEKEVAVPAEGEFLTVAHIKSISTWSGENGCHVSLQFEWGTDMSVATGELRDRIERLKLRLPADVDNVYLRRWGRDDWAAMWMGMFGGESKEEMVWLARTHVQPALMRIEGVAEVEVHGEAPTNVYAEFDQDALRSRNLSLYNVVAALRMSNVNVSIGRLVDGNTRYYVRARDEFTDPSEIANLIVGPNGLRVKDVAEVCVRNPREDWLFTMDGKRGAFLSVKKESQANTVAVCEAVHDALEGFHHDPLFGDVEFRVFHDQSEMITSTIDSLVQAGQYGGFLALVVLFVFLRRVRATLLVALAIPSSLLLAVVYMYFAGLSFNIVTMSGMIVSVGMLVDNSIVVLENTYRHFQMGERIAVSARRGASEVALAITAATLTSLVVFIPTFYMQAGEMSIYMRHFATPICVALLGSLVLALTVIPLASLYAFRRKDRAAESSAPSPSQSMSVVRRLWRFELMGFIARTYARVLDMLLGRRLLALVLLALVVALTYWFPVKRVGMRQMPDVDRRQVYINVEVEQNCSEEGRKALFASLEGTLDGLREPLGIENLYVSHGPWGGHISVHLRKPGDLNTGETVPYTTDEVRSILAEKLCERAPGAKLYVDVPHTTDEGSRTISLSLRGDDAEVTRELAERFKETLDRHPQIERTKTDEETAKPEIRVHIDSPRASDAGVNAMALAQTVGFALGGARLPYMKREGREVEVWAQFQDADRATAEDLENVAVITPQGKLIPLEQIVNTTKGSSPRSLDREDGKSVTRVTVETTTENMTAVQDMITGLVKVFKLPRGYSIDFGEAIQSIEESKNSFVGALALAIILMYLLMAALFESFLLPLSILTTVPLAFVGVYWSMFITQTPLDTVSLIGGILMCGIIVNNGIVIIDHINQLRRRHGMARTDAILRGSQDRLRPVLMTALTTILGCVPLAIGHAGGQDMLYTVGRALVGGLTMGTLLTLFVVPVSYSFIDDLQIWIVGYLSDVVRVVRPKASEASE